LQGQASLQFGDDAVVEVTGLRSPCNQLNKLRKGLMDAVLGRDEKGFLVLRAGIMGIVLTGGEVRPGDPIRVALPHGPHKPLARV
jgi:MOSC domain-containing protein YiiM